MLLSFLLIQVYLLLLDILIKAILGCIFLFMDKVVSNRWSFSKLNIHRIHPQGSQMKYLQN